MNKNWQVMEFGDRYHIVKHTDDSVIDNAQLFVNECLTGKRGFCYAEVKKYPLYDHGRYIMAAQVVIDRINSDPTLDGNSVHHLREKRDMLRAKAKQYIMFDLTAYKTLRSNFDKLKKCLHLLEREGYVESHILMSDGLLRVNYFQEYRPSKVRMIKQSWTYFRNTDKPWDGERQLTDRMFALYCTTRPIDTQPNGYLDAELLKKVQWRDSVEGVVAVTMNNTGFLPVQQGKDKTEVQECGAGEYDPNRLRERDQDNEAWRNYTKALYIDGEERRKVDTYA